MTVFNATGLILTCRDEDREGLRVAAALLSDRTLGLAKPPVAEVLGMHRTPNHRVRVLQQVRRGRGAGLRSKKPGLILEELPPRR